MRHTLSTPTLNCAGLRRWHLFARSKSPRHPVNAGMGSLRMSDAATPPIPCNPRDMSRGLHGIGGVGLPSHFSEVGFFGKAIEPSHKPFFRRFTRALLVCLGRRVEVKLVDPFSLLLMSLLSGEVELLLWRRCFQPGRHSNGYLRQAHQGPHMGYHSGYTNTVSYC